MSTGSGNGAQTAQGDGLAEAYAQMRADPQTQFTPVDMPSPEEMAPPEWLKDLFEWLGDLFRPVAGGLVDGWPVIRWVLIGLGVLLLVFLLWRLFGPDLFTRRAPKAPEQAGWVPDSRAALALLEDADRLAAAGRFDEATHLLLQRSVGQIAGARPDLVDPSSTARELAAEPALPEGARRAFGVIAQRVERSLFALDQLGQDDWQAARDAYAEFALARLSASAA